MVAWVSNKVARKEKVNILHHMGRGRESDKRSQRLGGRGKIGKGTWEQRNQEVCGAEERHSVDPFDLRQLGGQTHDSTGAERHGILGKGNDHSSNTPLPAHYSKGRKRKATVTQKILGGRETDRERGRKNPHDSFCEAENKREMVDFCNPRQLENLLSVLRGTGGHESSVLSLPHGPSPKQPCLMLRDEIHDHQHYGSMGLKQGGKKGKGKYPTSHEGGRGRESDKRSQRLGGRGKIGKGIRGAWEQRNQEVCGAEERHSVDPFDLRQLGGQTHNSTGAERHGIVGKGNDHSSNTPLPAHYSKGRKRKATVTQKILGGKETDRERGRKNPHDSFCEAENKREMVDFCNPRQLENLLKAKVGHQVSSFLRNPSLLTFLRSSSSDFTSVALMMNLLDNIVFCGIEPLKKQVEKDVVPRLLENRGFLDSLMHHLCSLPKNAGDQERAGSVSFVGHVCKLFEFILGSGDIALASTVLPVDALWGTIRQITTQEMRFQPLHDKAKELLEMRDKIRQTLYDTSEKMAMENDVIVLPTQKELEQKTLPIGLLRNIIDGPYPSALQYLDIQYRLLREDFIHPLRCAFHEIERAEEEGHSMKIYDNVTIKSESYSTFDGSAFNISFRAQGHHQIKWDRTKCFTYGDLVCLMNDDCSTILFATVAERNAEDLRRGIVTIDFRTNVDIMGLPPTGYRMIQSPGFYAAYAPILRHLHVLQQNPESLPFSRYIVECKTDVQLPAYIPEDCEFVLNLHTAMCTEKHDPGEVCPCTAVNVLDEEVWMDTPSPNLDDSQKRALRSALTRELSIIQGPPGTGKTYIGLKVVETLLQNRASWDKDSLALGSTSSVVVVCYTNHALDQFLEGIIQRIRVTLDKNTQVRRIGGRSKNQLVQEYNINTFVRNHLRARGIFGFWRKKNSKIVQKIDALNDLLKCRFDPAKVKVYASFIGAEVRLLILNCFNFSFLTTARSEEVASWFGLNPHRINSFTSFHDATEADRRIADEEDEEKEIVQQFGENQLQDFFQQFAKVEPLTKERANEVIQSNTIEPYVRLQLFKYGLHSVKEELEEKLKMGKEREERYEEQRRMAMIHCLQEADIIGLTTTGAAKYNSLLSKIDAKIIIIEEAAEVLEAHIVSSLNQNTQHLILIGDHKQLRPKTNDHILARDFRLDVSLFERLVKNGFPCVTLQVQHRMRPEISALVSSNIYQNGLIDAPSTEEYPPVVGIKHNMFFVDHTEQETADHDLKSPANDFEAYFLARLCKYLLQQCTYVEEQITVITPYTGQMYNLRERFGDMNMTKVRITPIDSYQGEENDIILLSLVRSEKPGFVKDENRICVAMSRAKHGLYVIGNFSKLFKHRSKLWRSIIRDMETQGKFGKSLALVCKGHETITEVGKAEDFDIKVSDGGCSLPCNSRLPCNHMCPLKCHPNRELHFKIQCEEPCPVYCPEGHRCKKKCHECPRGCGQCEEKVDKRIPKCGHQQLVPCHCDPKNFTCQEPCTEILLCGHKCKNTCGEPHTTECLEYITREWPCKHKATVECFITEERYSKQCKATCGETLMCGHVCQGTCGVCRQGRLHKPCKDKCNRILTCGHACTSPCAQSCPPCEKQCPFQCVHGPCDHMCHELCRPCPHDCGRECEHQRCTRTCGVPCDCKPCDEPCRKKLACTHDCTGLCGEKCPDVCRICNRDNFNDKIPLIFGTEDVEDPELRIIMIDCGHKFDVKKMDSWMESKHEEQKIQWRECFLCRQPIFKTNRYMELSRGIVASLNQVKQKEFIMSKEERRQCEGKLKVMVRTSQLIRNPDRTNTQLRYISDRRLQAEYIIFCAEQSVTKAMEDTHEEMDTDITMQIQSRIIRSKDFQELYSARKTLKNQKEDFISNLESYRKQESITEQVLHDVQAEQHRIQLLSVVLKVQSQIKAKNIQINIADQVKLDMFLTDYETRGDRVCRLKISSAEYESSMTYIENLRKRHPDITGISRKEKQMIIRALNAKTGSWYKCPNGHVYNIGQCGGAMEESKCPECNSTIGGGSHHLREDNTRTQGFDDSL